MEEEAASSETGSHDWPIKNYCLLQFGCKIINSDVFTMCGHRWMIRLYPKGTKPQEIVFLFLHLMDDKSDLPSAPVQVETRMYILNQSGRGDHRSIPFGSPTLLKPRECIGSGVFVSLGPHDSPFLKDDCLIIRCEISVRDGADVSFKVGEEIFWGHKSILVASSPVFRSLLELDNNKPVPVPVPVPDMEPRIFKAMLGFIYTETLVDEEDQETAQHSFLGKILAAAHRFELTKLKKICESRLLKKMSVDSVANMFRVAELCDATELKAACLRFAAGNREAVLDTEGCEYLKKSCPSMFVEWHTMNHLAAKEGTILSTAMDPLVSVFSFLGASDFLKQKIKET